METDPGNTEKQSTSVDSLPSRFETGLSAVVLHLGIKDATMDKRNRSLEHSERELPLSSSPKKRNANEANVVGKESLADWGVLVCVFLSNTITAIDFTGFGVFYPFLVEHFEVTTAAVGWCSSINGFFQAIVALFVSYPIQSYGCRLPGVVGCLLFSLGMSLSFLAPNLTTIYLTYGVIAGSGTGLYVLSAGIIVHQRFSRNRTLASGIGWLGYSVGGIMGANLTNVLIQSYGWRGTFLILGAIHAQRIPLCLFFRTPNRFTSQSKHTAGTSPSRISSQMIWKYLKETFNFSILRHARYSIYAAAYFLHVFCMIGYMQHTVNRAIHVGLGRDQGVAAVTLVSFVSLVLRLFVSFIANLPMVNSSLIFGTGMFSAFLSIVAIFLNPGVIGTMTSAVLFGIHLGCTITVFTVVAVDLMGVAFLPKCLAVLQFTGGFARLASPPLIGLVFDVTHDYSKAFAIIGCGAFVSGCLMVVVAFITRRHRKSLAKDPPKDTQSSSSTKTSTHLPTPDAQT